MITAALTALVGFAVGVWVGKLNGHTSPVESTSCHWPSEDTMYSRPDGLYGVPPVASYPERDTDW